MEEFLCDINIASMMNNLYLFTKAPNRYKLFIMEAILISHKSPSITKQFETFVHSEITPTSFY